jgi:hypothetical protein
MNRAFSGDMLLASTSFMRPAKKCNIKGTYAELLAAPDDVVEKGVARTEMLWEAEVLLLPSRLSHHLQPENTAWSGSRPSVQRCVGS